MEKTGPEHRCYRCQLCRHRHPGSEMSLEEQVRVNQMKKALLSVPVLTVEVTSVTPSQGADVKRTLVCGQYNQDLSLRPNAQRAAQVPPWFLRSHPQAEPSSVGRVSPVRPRF